MSLHKENLWYYEVILIVVAITLLEVSTSQSCNKHCSACRSDICRECFYGYWASNCHKKCQNCWLGGCEKLTGRCNQCNPGKYTDDCDLLCPPKCRPGHDGVKNCHRFTGNCLEGCSKGWWGPRCERKCGKGCSGGHCYQTDGECITECKGGWNGRKCDCHDNCLNAICYRSSCAHGCKRGWAGIDCTQKCNERCLRCDQDTKHCSVCEKGWLGGKCSRYNCQNDMPDNGICKQGCKQGWTGASCTENCGEGCLACDQYAKVCTSCKTGLYGSRCESECSSNCVSYDCNMNGACVKSCKPGFQGEQCDKPCPFNCLECEQQTDICNKCKIGFAGLYCKLHVDKSQSGDEEYEEDMTTFSGGSLLHIFPTFVISWTCAFVIVR